MKGSRDYKIIFTTPYKKLLNTDLWSVYITLYDIVSKATSPEQRSHCQQNTP